MPNVSSVQLAFARLGKLEDAAFVSVTAVRSEGLAAVVGSRSKVAVLTGGKNTPAVVARWLINHGVDGYQAYLCENLGGADERVRKLDLEALADVETTLLNVVVLIKRELPLMGAPRYLLKGIPEEEFFHLRGMITKAEIRVVSLAKWA